jgi:Family of unknown function (DUF6350)
VPTHGPSARRSLVPETAGRSLWLAAVWTGAGAALVGAIIAIAVVAICWLPAAHGAGSASSAIRAGVLAFLAALHGGITVDGLPSLFVPLGMTLGVAALAWRAGSGLADIAAHQDEDRWATLLRAGALQAAAFAATCGVAAHFAALGTSSVSALAATLAGLLLFAAFGGVAFVRASALRDAVADWLPPWAGPAGRAAAAALAVYLAAGALLVAAALVVHHGRVETLSHEVGGGWSGLPILLLGVLAAPNAAVSGAAYLAGPGFALGTGSGVSLGSTVHGTLPAFPVLGGVPAGPATVPVWLLAGATPFVAGVCAARIARTAAGWRAALRIVCVAALLVTCGGLVMAWQAGGAIGSGRLSAFGASPWRFGLATGAAVGVVASAAVGALAALAWWRARRARTADDADGVDEAPQLVAVVATAVEETHEDPGADVLAG